jgi:hypothetical protein
VLGELDVPTRARDVYPLVTRAFPEITPQELAELLPDGKTNKWINRIQWAHSDLAKRGLLDGSEHGVRAIAAELAGEGDSGTQEPKVQPVVPPKEVGALIEELRETAADSQAPERFEWAATKAFQSLGFEAERIGGAGRTDVLLNAPLGLYRYRVVVDAKSTNKTRVADAQVDWLSIKAHRQQEHADHASVLGTSFAGGHLADRAREFDVALLTVDGLAQVLQLHEAGPLTLVELRPLFEGTAESRAVLAQLRAAASDRRRRALLWRLLTLVDSFNRAQPDIVLAKPEALFASVIADRELLGTTLDDIRRALALLETVGILASVGGEGYVSQTSLAGRRSVSQATEVTFRRQFLSRRNQGGVVREAPTGVLGRLQDKTDIDSPSRCASELRQHLWDLVGREAHDRQPLSRDAYQFEKDFARPPDGNLVARGPGPDHLNRFFSRCVGPSA